MLFANFLIALARVVHLVLMLYVWVVIVRAILTWVRVPSFHQVSVVLYYLTEPVLRPLRRIVPPYKFGGLDISPVIVILIILFVDSFLVKSLSLYAQDLLRQGSWRF